MPGPRDADPSDPMSTDASTPLMRQYNSIKQQVPNALLMFRLGDFYELFFEDAVTAARELEITLTSRNKEKGAAIPMCGVPYHAAEGYIARLIQKGYRVAICDQMEDPAPRQEAGEARDHARSSRPAPPWTPTCVRSRENNYLAAVARAGDRSGVAHVDLSTGEFRVTEMEPAEVAGALEQLGAREVLFPGDLPLRRPPRPAAAAAPVRAHRAGRLGLQPGLRRPHPARPLQAALARWLRPGRPPRGRGRGRRHPALPARDAARRARPPGPARVLRPRRFHGLDAVTVRNLELVEPLFAADAPSAGQAPATVLGVLDQQPHRHGRPPAAPAPAAPVAGPRRDRAAPRRRGRAARSRTILRAELRKQLAGMLDIERLLAKVTLGSAGPRDLLALGRSLEKIPGLKRLLRTQAGGAPCAR